MRAHAPNAPSRACAAALAAALALGGPLPARGEVRNPDTFVCVILGDIDSLDPHWQYDGNSMGVLIQAYEGLIGYKGASVSEYAPLVAAVVPSKANGLVSPDGKTYTFPIRKGVRFHDGSLLTPEDARYSLLRALLLDRAGGSSALLLEPLLGISSTRGKDGKPAPGVFEAAERAVRVEGGALVLRLHAPYAPLLPILAEFSPVVSKGWTASHGGWDGSAQTWTRHNNPAKETSPLHASINGTGPFKLERWDPNQKQLVLARNEGYWGKPAKLRRLVFKTVDEFGARKLLLQAGDADGIFLERQFAPQLDGLPGVILEDELPLMEVHNAFVLNFNINPEANSYVGSGRLDGRGIPPDFFSDPDVRRGFAHAFDYEAYIRDGYRGKGTRAHGPILSPLPGYDPAQPLIPYDLEKAATHLKTARGGEIWKNGFLLTAVYMQGHADRQLACAILKRGIESLNPKFKVDIRGVQWSTLLAAGAAHKVPLQNARWLLDFPDPHNCVHAFLHSQGYYAQLSRYSNPRADRLVDTAVRELDPARRRTLYRELQKIAYEDLPAIFTLETYYLRGRRSWVQGWTHNPMLPYGYFNGVYKQEGGTQ